MTVSSFSSARAAFAAIGLAFVLQATHASAADPEQEAKRTELYREGMADGEKGNWSSAVKKFRDVVAIRSAPKALIALAVALEKTGRFAEARRTYARALADAHTLGPSHGDEARAANEALTRITPKVPRITPLLPSDVGARAYVVDGEKLDLQDGAIDVDVGSHSLDVESTDGRHFTKSITVKEGDRINVWVTFPPPSSTPATPPTPPATKPAADRKPSPPPVVVHEDSLPIAPVIVTGVGALTAGAGAVLWALGRGDESDAKDACNGRTENCPRSIESTVDSAHSKIALGNVVFVVGLAVLAGGAVWWLLSSRSSPPHATGLATSHHARAPVSSWRCATALCF